MIAPRKPLPSRLLRVRWRALPAARALRRGSPRTGAGWLPVGLRWRRVARQVSGAAAPLAPRAASRRQRERQPGWRVRTVMLPAAAAPGRRAAPRGLPGARGAAGLALHGEAGRHGAVYRTGMARQPRPPSYLAPAPSRPVRQLPASALAAAMPAAHVAAARLEWRRRRPPATAATPLQQRAPAPMLGWRSPTKMPRPSRVGTAGAAPSAQALALLGGGAAPGAKIGAGHAATRIDWRVRTRSPAVTARAAGATVRALALRAELVWRTAAASAQSGTAATPRMALRHSPRGHADAPGAAAPSPATIFPAALPAAPAMLDAAATERLVDDVLRRAEQRLRVERERRGL